jgi:hypothetical protein
MKVRKFEHPSVGYVLEPNVESGDFVQKCDFVKSWQLENPRKYFHKHFSPKKKSLGMNFVIKRTLVCSI